MKNKLILFLIFIFIGCNAQNCNCDSLFYSVKNTIEKNYPGYFDKVNMDTKKDYEIWTSQYTKNISTIKSDSLCFLETKKWLTFYKDKHIQLKFKSNKKSIRANTATLKPIEILQISLTETDFKDYLNSKTKKDIIEGIWESSTYKLAIKKSKTNIFQAVVLESQNPNWKKGEVKLIIEKVGSKYSGTFFEGDKSDKSQHNVTIVDNILDFEIVYFEKKFPAPGKVRNSIEYEIQQDKQAPKLTFKNSDLAIFTFPNFYGNSYEQLEFLLKHNKEKLSKTPYWIIDLRDNDGGDYNVGKQLLPFLYTKSIIDYNSKMRITESNIKLWFETYLKNYYDSQTKEKQEEIDLELKKLLANHKDEIYDDKPISDTLKFEIKSEFPKKVSLLINKNTVSSGELFTMLARQSDKVKVYGENTYGMMDYGNLVTYTTTCTAIRLKIPINRQNWLDEGFSVDKEGIKPEIHLNQIPEKWIDYVYSKMKL